MIWRHLLITRLLEILCSCYIHCCAGPQIISLMSSGEGFPGSKNPPNWFRAIIFSGPKFYSKREFQFGVLKFPLNFLRKTHVSLWVFESALAGHAGCYYPVFGPSMLIFQVWGHAPSVMTVSDNILWNRFTLTWYFYPYFSGLAALMSVDVARNIWSLVCSCLNSYGIGFSNMLLFALNSIC